MPARRSAQTRPGPTPARRSRSEPPPGVAPASGGAGRWNGSTSPGAGAGAGARRGRAVEAAVQRAQELLERGRGVALGADEGNRGRRSGRRRGRLAGGSGLLGGRLGSALDAGRRQAGEPFGAQAAALGHAHGQRLARGDGRGARRTRLGTPGGLHAPLLSRAGGRGPAPAAGGAPPPAPAGRGIPPARGRGRGGRRRPRLPPRRRPRRRCGGRVRRGGRGGQGGDDPAGEAAGLGGEPGERRPLGVEPLDDGGEGAGEAAEGRGLLGALDQHLEDLLLAGLDHREPAGERAAGLGSGGKPRRLDGEAGVDHRLGAGTGGGEAGGHRVAFGAQEQDGRLGERGVRQEVGSADPDRLRPGLPSERPRSAVSIASVQSAAGVAASLPPRSSGRARKA